MVEPSLRSRVVENTSAGELDSIDLMTILSRSEADRKNGNYLVTKFVEEEREVAR